MPLPYYDLLGHAAAAAHGFENSTELSQAMRQAGLSGEAIAAAAKLTHDGESLVERKLEELGENRIYEHNVHVATTELEMWQQTTRFLLRTKLAEPSLVALAMAEDLHTHEHAVTAIARSHRLLSVIRTDERVHGPLGDYRKVRDLLNRGWALTQRLYRSTEIRLADGLKANPSAPIFDELLVHRARMTRWLIDVDRASRAVPEKDARVLGLLGYAPEGVGIPVGGNSYAVVLHERGQTDAPDPAMRHECTGWSIGRQGRNNENLGGGFIVPTFERP